MADAPLIPLHPDSHADPDGPRPRRLATRLEALHIDGTTTHVTFATWDPDVFTEPERRYTMEIGQEPDGCWMTPTGDLADCMNVMASTRLEDLTGPDLRRAWLTGDAADELTAQLTASGLLVPFYRR